MVTMMPKVMDRLDRLENSLAIKDPKCSIIQLKTEEEMAAFEHKLLQPQTRETMASINGWLLAILRVILSIKYLVRQPKMPLDSTFGTCQWCSGVTQMFIFFLYHGHGYPLHYCGHVCYPLSMTMIRWWSYCQFALVFHLVVHSQAPYFPCSAITDKPAVEGGWKWGERLHCQVHEQVYVIKV